MNIFSHQQRLMVAGETDQSLQANQPMDSRLCDRRIAKAIALVSDRAYTASFSSLAGRKAIFLLALILIASPVAGFRPIVAAPFRT
jgi:hypothetical protein